MTNLERDDAAAPEPMDAEQRESGTEPRETNGGGRFAAAIAACTALALGLRWFQLTRTHLIFTDSAHYVDMARMLLRGDLEGVIRHEYHPLFGALIAAISPFSPNLVDGAMLVSVFAGALAVIPLAIVMRQIGGPTVGVLAAIGYAISPYPIRYAAAGNSEALYLLLFLTAVAFGVRALVRDGLVPLVLCAVLSGLAYLVRPEGAGVFGVVLGLAFLRAVGRAMKGDRRMLRPLLACGVLFVVLGGGYLAYEYKTTGTFGLTAKKSIGKMLGFLEGEAPAAGENERPSPLGMAGMVGDALVSAMSYPLAALALIGAFARRRVRRQGSGERWLLCLFLAYVAVLLLLVNGYGYVSRRHATPPSCLALGWAAMGAIALHAWLARAAGKLASPERARVVAAAFLALAVFGASAAKAFKPAWEDQVAIRRAGEWLATQREQDPDLRIVTPYKWADPRIPVYGGIPIDQPTIGSTAELISYLDGMQREYFAVIDIQIDRRCTDPDAFRADPRFQKIHVEPFEGRRDRNVVIYRYVAGG